MEADEKLKSQVALWKQGEKKSDVRVDELRNRMMRIVHLVVVGLLDEIQDGYEKIVSKEEWKRMNQDEKRKVKAYLFKMEHGHFPDYFATKLYTKLMGVA